MVHFQPYSETKIVASVLDNLCNINLVSVSREDIKLTTLIKNYAMCIWKVGVRYPPLQKVRGTRTPRTPTFYAYVLNDVRHNLTQDREQIKMTVQ